MESYFRNIKDGIYSSLERFTENTKANMRDITTGLLIAGAGLGITGLASCSDYKEDVVDPNCVTPIVTPAGDTLYAVFRMIPAGTMIGADTVAIDLNKDVKFTLGYNPGRIPGIDNVTFREITPAEGYHGEGITGIQRRWYVDQITGEPAAVAHLQENIGGDKILTDVWLLRDDGTSGSIIYGIPEQATRIKVELNVTHSPGKGIDSMFTNGVFFHTVEAYGQTGRLSITREHYIPIVNPSLKRYLGTLPLREDRFVGFTFISEEDAQRLLDSLNGG